MNRASAVVVMLAVLIASLLRVVSANQSQQPVFRSGTMPVRVDVSVRDRARVVTGLAVGDFQLLDNGVRQDITDASYGKLPIDVTIALDLSYSVNGSQLDALRHAIVQLMSDLGRGDRLKFVTFNMQTSRVVDFTTDAAAVERAIRSATAGGGTSIYDAISVALISPAPLDRRQLAVVFTDGADNMSVTEPGTLLEIARRANTSLTVVSPALATMTMVSPLRGAPSPVQSGAQRGRALFFSQVAAVTGGQLIAPPPGANDLTATFRRALDDFRSSYVLHFTPHGVDAKGYHTIEVTVPGKDGLIIRARRGYSVD